VGNNILDESASSGEDGSWFFQGIYPPNKEGESKTSYPQYWAWENPDWKDFDGEDVMEFQLVYEGPLNGSGNRKSQVGNKHAIRKCFHRQLAILWSTNPLLSRQANRINLHAQKYIHRLAHQFNRCGFLFAPLVTKELGLVCNLNILLLRRKNPGQILNRDGDIDNQLKTLFDACRLPVQCTEVAEQPTSDETPFFCLLEDDTLITKVNVTTERLLTPVEDGQSENHTLLIIGVTVKQAIEETLPRPLNKWEDHF